MDEISQWLDSFEFESYSKQDMFNFSNYMRNGISNLEYCSKTQDQHLQDWIDKNTKTEPKPIK